MKRSLEEPTSEPRKSSRSSHTETENASSLKVVKKNRRDSEGQPKVVSASSRATKLVAASLTSAESYAKQKASAKQWAEEEFKSKVSPKKSPYKPAAVAPLPKAETVPAVTRKTRKSVSTSTNVPPPVARGVRAESVINKPATVSQTPLIKIERPRPQQEAKIVSMMAAPREGPPAPATTRTSRMMKAALGMPFVAVLVLHVLEKKPIPSSILNCPIEAFISVAFIGLLHMCA